MITSLGEEGSDVIRFCMICFDNRQAMNFLVSYYLVTSFLFNMNISFVLFSIVITSRGEERVGCCVC